MEVSPWMSADANLLKVVVVILGFATAVLTAFYVFKVLLLVFLGEFRATTDFPSTWKKLKEVPWPMFMPMVLLAMLSIFVVFSWNPFEAAHNWFLPVFDEFNVAGEGHYHLLTLILSIACVGIGTFAAWRLYSPKNARHQAYLNASTPQSAFGKLSWNNWFLDTIYLKTVVAAFLQLSSWMQKLEERVIDAFVNLIAQAQVVFAHIIAWFDRSFVDGAVNFSVLVAEKAGVMTKSIQASRIQSMLIWIFLCLVAIVLFILF